MNKPQTETLFTQSLKQFVESHLGRGDFLDIHGNLYYDVKWQYRPIDSIRAAVIVGLTNNKHTCYIQYADEFSPHLTTPLLWDYGAWLNQTDRWLAEKERSHKERIEWYILQANIKICVKKWMNLYLTDEEQATKIVSRLLRQNKHKQVMAALEIEKLVEKESELI